MDKILIIDDSLLACKRIEDIFMGKMDVAICNDPLQSIFTVKREMPDIILLDVVMPNISGFDIYKLIKEEENISNIPVIFITSRADDETIDTCFNLGADDYVKKPFNEFELIHRVLMHVENHKTNKQLKLAIEEISRVANIDYLTGLYNRRYLTTYIYNAKETGNNFIALCDIDNFKRINDNYGHDCGDFILKSVSYIIKKTILKNHITARWGGEEFIIFFEDSSADEAFRICEEIREQIKSQQYKFRDFSINITISFGISQTKDVGVKDAIRFADQSLYCSKDNGKDMCILWNR
ncbi:MAG: GGDEF domain-containing response regulator [Oscillospiraceae bacterium]